MRKLKILWVLALAMLIVPTLATANGKKGGHQSGGHSNNRHCEYDYPWFDPPYESYRYSPHTLPSGDFYFSTPGNDYLPYVAHGYDYHSYDYGYHNQH